MPVTVLNASYILFLYMVTATPSGIINVIRDEKNKTQHI